MIADTVADRPNVALQCFAGALALSTQLNHVTTPLPSRVLFSVPASALRLKTTDQRSRTIAESKKHLICPLNVFFYKNNTDPD